MIKIVTFPIQLLHSWYAKAHAPGQDGLLHWRHHSLGYSTKDSAAGVHDYQLPERCKHLPEG